MRSEGESAVVSGAGLRPAWDAAHPSPTAAQQQADLLQAKRATARARAAQARAKSVAGKSRAALRLRAYIVLAGWDLVLITASFGLAALIRAGDPADIDGLNLLVAILPLYFLLALRGKVYSVATLQSPREGARRAIRCFFIAAAIFLVIAFYFRAFSHFSRAIFGIGIVLAVLFMLIGKWWAGQSIGKRLGWSFTTNIVLVDRLSYFPRQGDIVIYMNSEGLSPAMPNPELLNHLGRLLKDADRVVLACMPTMRPIWTRLLRGADVDIEVLAPELNATRALALRRLGDQTTIVVSAGPLGLPQRALKRGFDLAIAVPAVVLLSPMLLAIAAAVKLSSPGPVLFRQPRIGRGNRIFHVLKFRSMRVDCGDEAGNRSTSRADDRFTRVGKILRRTSLDELPQLLNVIVGNMSLVGPRPHALGSTAEDRPFWAIETRYYDRHSMKPGITGLAQVRGYRGATETRADLVNRVDADLEYIGRWSISLDLLIMLRTARAIVSSNAY